MKKAERIGGNVASYVDDRTGAAKWLRKNLTKVFPDHWSFMLGEIVLYSFVILLLSGTFLTFWFDPSQREVVYEGSYEPLQDIKMSAAYASALHISFDVRGGLLMRQIHHWSALLFMAGMIAHLMRVFFTGAFRKPREANWLIGVGLVTLGIVEGFLGYSLPDDLLSGTGVRIAEAIIQALPVVGSYLAFFAFGGAFPGEAFIPRIYTVHVLLLPAAFLALITIHLMLVWYQKHTQYPGPGRTEKNVVGYPLMPIYMAKAGGFFFIVFGVTALLGALASINPIWLYGPYNPGQVSAGSQPDFYMGWLDGLVRMFPPLESYVLGYTISWNILIPGLIIPGILFTLMALYPFIESWMTGDKSEHHLLDRPRNNPNLVFVITKRICLSLQRADREKVLHGRETGRLVMLPHGEFVEIHEELTPAEKFTLTQHLQPKALVVPDTDANGVKNPQGIKGKIRARFSQAHVEQIPAPTESEAKALGSGHH